jgi:hypothetical protein
MIRSLGFALIVFINVLAAPVAHAQDVSRTARAAGARAGRRSGPASMRRSALQRASTAAPAEGQSWSGGALGPSQDSHYARLYAASQAVSFAQQVLTGARAAGQGDSPLARRITAMVTRMQARIGDPNATSGAVRAATRRLNAAATELMNAPPRSDDET